MDDTKISHRLINVICIILVILLFTIMYFGGVYKEKHYTYYLNKEFGTSNECYIKDDNAYCVIEDEETKVDLYYEVGE